MAFDRKKRGSRRGYYYQSVRVGGRPVKRYVASGEEAARLAGEVERRRRDQRADRKALVDDVTSLLAAQSTRDQFVSLALLLALAELLLAGFHEHRGQWKRSR